MQILFFMLLFFCTPALAADWDDSLHVQSPEAASMHDCASLLQDSPLTLAAVVELSLCRNPQTRSAWAQAKAAAAQLGLSKAARYPTLSLQGSASRDSSDAASIQNNTQQQSLALSMNYLLYDFGGREAGIESARQSLLAANASGNAVMQTVFLQAAQAYFSLMSARASLQASQSSELAAGQSLKAAEARYQAGMTTIADRLQAKTALSQEKLNRIRAEAVLQNARGTLANVMGFSPTLAFTLAQAPEVRPDIRLEDNLEQLISKAEGLRPDLIAAEARVSAAQANVDVAKSSDNPQLVFSATVQNGRNNPGGAYQNIHSNSLALTFSFPIFTGFQATYQTSLAQAQLQTSQQARDQLAQQVAMQVWQAWQNLRSQGQALQSAEDLLASASEAQALSLGRYEENVGNILDLLSAQQMLASARQQHVDALYNWHLDRLMLAQAIGALDLSVLPEFEQREP